MLKKSPSKNLVPGASKSKKLSKDKDKKKDQNVDKQIMMSSVSMMDETSTNASDQMMCEENYAVFDSDTVSCIAEQFLGEEISEDVCSMLAEDISYKMRELLNVMCINMHQGKRKYLKTDDVNSAFKRLNIEPIYGADEPNWITFDDPNNLSCIPEKSVDLLELAQEEAKFIEPGDIGLDYKWLMDDISDLVDDTLKNYCQKIMISSISNKESLRALVLKNVHRNINVGPMLPHLCNFCFLILQKNITYSFLATPVLELLEAITFNPCVRYTVEDKQMTLLVYLLLEKVMNATNAMLDEVYPICRTIGRLCECWPGAPVLIVEKIKKHSSPKVMQGLTAPVVCTATFIGALALDALVWSHIDEICMYLNHVDLTTTAEFRAVLLTAIVVLCKQPGIDFNILNKLRLEFGDSLVPVFNTVCSREFPETGDELVPDEWAAARIDDWSQIKMLLSTHRVHSRQQTTNRSPQLKAMFSKAAPFVRKKSIIISGFKTLPIKRKEAATTMPATDVNKLNSAVNIIVGRRTLLTLKTTKKKKHCKNDYLLYGF